MAVGLKMNLIWKQWFRNKQNHMVMKLALGILLMGLAFRLLFFRSTRLSPVLEETPLAVEAVAAIPLDSVPVQENADQKVGQGKLDLAPPDSVQVQENGDKKAAQGKLDLVTPDSVQVQENGDQKVAQAPEKCDLFSGDWIPNPSGPIYTNESCPLIESHQNCVNNGRPDTGYLYWRWNPRNCELPPFYPEGFLQKMRNKTWALIGDSISRNHVQSLLCMLSTVEQAVQVYHDEDYRSKGWNFPSYNFTIYVLWSPFLVKAAIFEDFNGISTSEVELHLDKLDKTWTDQYQNLDYVIFSTGKWFLKSAIYHENETVLGCHYCPKRNLTELGFDFAYRKALQYVMDFIATSNHKGLILFRTSTPDHFENGEWDTGGYCNKTAPVKEGEIEMKDLPRILRRIELEEFEKAAEKASRNRVNLKLLDVALLSVLRPDGHPGPYREFHPFAQNNNATVTTDCLHWCLPGPIDSWNDIIMEMVVNG